MKVTNEKTGKIEDKRLPKIFKAKWLKALRSGKYEQAKGRLHDGSNGYCCLGVACRIQNPKLNIIQLGFITEKNFGDKLPKMRIPKLLIGGNVEDCSDYNLIVSVLSNMNDAGKSFKEIANYISKNL